MTHRTQRLLSAAGITVLFAAVITHALLTRVEDIDDTPMSTALPGWHAYPVPLLETAGPPPPVYVIWLRPDSMLEFLRYPELRIYFSAYEGSAQLRSGTIEVLGTECVYETPAGTDLDDSSLVRFVQGPGCYPRQGAPTGDAKLVVRLAERHRIGVGALVPIAPQADQGPDSIRVIGTPGAGKEAFPVLRGYYVDHLAPTFTRRIDLLAFMWRIRATWIWRFVGLACVLLFAGAIITPHGQVSDLSARARFALRASAGAGCAAAALGLLYAVIVPPLQAADEPTHLLAFVELTGRSELVERAREWSMLNHFERLRFQPDERFRPIDAVTPAARAWQEWPLSSILERGSQIRLWAVIAPRLGALSLSRMLLVLRLLNGLPFALAVSIGVAAVVLLTDVPFPQRSAFVFLFVPSLPFFATFVSNYAPLTAAYVLISFAVIVTVFGGRRSHYAGLMLGLALGLAVSLSRSALPMGAMIGAVAVGRLLIGEPDVVALREGIRRAVIFWVGLSVTLATMLTLMTPDYTQYVTNRASARWPGIDWPVLLSGRYVLLGFVMSAIAVTAIDVGLFEVRRRLGKQMEHRIKQLPGRCGATAAALIGALMVASLFVDFPVLEYVDLRQRPEATRYVSHVLFSALGMFRLRNPDFLMSTSFWVGFGWLDSIPSTWLTVFLTTMTGLALISLLLHFATRRSVAGLAWLSVLGVGWTITLIIYAVATLKYSPDLHGRYLLGLYLSVLPICWGGLLLKHRANSAPATAYAWPALVSVCIVVHAYCLSVILSRYF